MLAEARRVYHQSRKPADSAFNAYLARPLAAPLVVLFARTRATPNQISFLSMATMIGALGLLAALPGWPGLLLGVVGLELSYVLDKVDGQLARVTGRASPIGAELDFLMDEFKAYLLVAAISGRWWLHGGAGHAAGTALPLWVGLATLVIVGSALSYTRFMRGAAYVEATGGQPVGHGEAGGRARQQTGPLRWITWGVRAISQYPVTLPIFAAVDRLDIFLYAYGAVHLLYVGQASLIVLLRLGRSAPPGDRRPQ